MIVFILLSTAATLCLARPDIHIDPQNIVTVPPNCPAGQEWINGQCRDVWRASSNCPRGQQFVNGQCRETWRALQYQIHAKIDEDISESRNAVTSPPNCKPSQTWSNGQCRDIWIFGAEVDVIPSNMVTVPSNCPPGQELINGVCRDIWSVGFQSSDDSIIKSNLMKSLLKSLLSVHKITRQDYEDDDIGIEAPKNVIGVPNQCPAGFRPDALGICREIYD